MHLNANGLVKAKDTGKARGKQKHRWHYEGRGKYESFLNENVNATKESLYGVIVIGRRK